ncbi:MAG: hypothetical protein VZQ61_06795 [Christensenellaceae bacterium]
MIGNAISNFFHKIVYGIIKVLADIVNTIINLMRMLLGMKPLSDGKTDNLLLNALFAEETVIAFITVIALSVVTTFVFAIIRVIKSNISDDKDDGGVSKGKAVKEILRSFLNVAVIPAFVIILVTSVTATAQALDAATGGGRNADYGTEIIFSVVDYDTLTTEGKNFYSATSNEYQIYILLNDQDLNDDGSMPDRIDKSRLIQLEKMAAVKHVFSGADYYTVIGNEGVLFDNPYNKSYDNFTKLVDHDKYFDNFLLPLLGGCVMMFTLAMSVLVVGQRLFYCVFLFIVSPFIISTRPLDDGARWRKWLEIFISKLMGSYGIIICLNVFFLLSSWLVGLQFFPAGSGLANGITKLVIYVAGVIAATGASQLVAQLIGADAGQQERDQAQNNFRSLMGGMRTAGAATRMAGALTGAFFGGKKTTPLSAAAGGLTGGTGQGGTAGGLVGNTMAAKIGNTLMGKNTLGDAAKATGQSIASSRSARIVGGAYLLGKGLAVGAYRAGTFVPRKISGGIQRAYAKKHPNSKTAALVARRDRLRAIEKNTSPVKRQQLYNAAKALTKNKAPKAPSDDEKGV